MSLSLKICSLGSLVFRIVSMNASYSARVMAIHSHLYPPKVSSSCAFSFSSLRSSFFSSSSSSSAASESLLLLAALAAARALLVFAFGLAALAGGAGGLVRR